MSINNLQAVNATAAVEYGQDSAVVNSQFPAMGGIHQADFAGCTTPSHFEVSGQNQQQMQMMQMMLILMQMMLQQLFQQLGQSGEGDSGASDSATGGNANDNVTPAGGETPPTTTDDPVDASGEVDAGDEVDASGEVDAGDEVDASGEVDAGDEGHIEEEEAVDVLAMLDQSLEALGDFLQDGAELIEDLRNTLQGGDASEGDDTSEDQIQDAEASA